MQRNIHSTMKMDARHFARYFRKFRDGELIFPFARRLYLESTNQDISLSLSKVNFDIIHKNTVNYDKVRISDVLRIANYSKIRK